VAKGNCAIDAAVNFVIRNRRQRNLVHLTPGLDSARRPGCRQTISRLRDFNPCTNVLLSAFLEHSERSPCEMVLLFAHGRFREYSRHTNIMGRPTEFQSCSPERADFI